MQNIFDLEPYSLSAEKKQKALLGALCHLHQHHFNDCEAYRRIVNAQWPALSLLENKPPLVNDLHQLPYLSVNLFKAFELRSVPPHKVFKTLLSSGTTGSPSRIFLDAETAATQSKVLVKIMQHWIGKQRLPMLIIDHSSTVTDRNKFSARGAGIQGLSFMGRNHCYALNEDMSINYPKLQQFCQQFGDGPVLIFGFTFIVWQFFIQALAREKVTFSLPQAILIHSGGWKKLEAEAVDNGKFKQQVNKWTGCTRIHNFYGMVEQIGAIFVECEQGHLHSSTYNDVIVRNPTQGWKSSNIGEEGILQLLSCIPSSYPGISLLTEDRGRILGEDDCPCGRKGKYFQVLGRLPRAEVRGCSDTFTPLTLTEARS